MSGEFEVSGFPRGGLNLRHAHGGQVVSGNVYVPQQPENFQYDADGNLTNDGRWEYVWDGESRLINMIVNTNVGPQYKLAFAYDPEGRRISKVVSTNGVGVYTNIFLYDLPAEASAQAGGWNLVATLSPSDSLINSFMWGPDLSGLTGSAFNGAGGVSGLLEVTYYGASNTNCFPAFDGNGNIMALVNAANGHIVANYEYGPFGEVIRATGPMAKCNPLRFSTKYQDDKSGLLYYGYRFYNPSTGRWPNRDLLREQGSKNLYAFVYGDPANQVDILGFLPFGGGVVGAIQLSYDVCKGNVTLNGWVWVGVGFEMDDHWVGASAYNQGNPLKTWSVPPLFKCGKCSSCCDKADAAGLHAAAGYFKGGLFGSQIIEGGVLFTPGSSLCDGNVEGIVLINLINESPGGALLVKAASLAGGKAEAGVQVNVDVHLFVGEHGGILVDSASISGGGYIDIVEGNVPVSPTGAH